MYFLLFSSLQDDEKRLDASFLKNCTKFFGIFGKFIPLCRKIPSFRAMIEAP